MSISPININEQSAATAFSKQSIVFDELYSDNTIIQYKRKRVRGHLVSLLQPGSHILELNAGTGEDAVWLAQQGFKIHATDISEGMLHKLREKIKFHQLESRISSELISFTQLDKLVGNKEYDCIFSNSAGLNCTDELDKVLRSFEPILKPSGVVLLAILPKFCLWENLLLFKGHFKTAFRRFFSSKGRKAHIEGSYFKCWYYNPSYVIKHLKGKFDLISVEGLCTLVPPSYIEGFAEKYPRLFSILKEKENKWKTKWPWRSIGDYYIISLRRRS
jgi:ubiquinone/menaquinone biosynthesis C-methylase UbiE